jgi:hypothetical protein
VTSVQGRHSAKKSLLRLLTAVLLGVGVSACGEASKGSGTAPRNSSGSAAASKGSGVLDFGHSATPVDRQAVTALVTRYYAAAAADNSATACSLIISSLANAVPEDYGQAPAPPYLRGGKTCQAVMSRLFTHFHRRMVTDAATLKVTQVRLKTTGGYAVLNFGVKPEREITVVREGHVWKVSSLLDSELF